METLKLLSSDILDVHTQMYYNIISQIENTVGRHKHDFYEIFVVTSGNVLHYVNNVGQFLPEGAIVFIRPDDIHYYEKSRDGNCQFINLAFSQEMLMDFLNYIGDTSLSQKLLTSQSPPIKLLSVADKEIAQAKLEAFTVIQRENKNQIRSYLKLLLADFIFNYFSEDTKPKTQFPIWLIHILNEIKKKENFSEGLSALQKLTTRSPEHISRVFKKYLGKTPTEYINELRLNYCANMLEYSDTSISDICYESGFDSLSHFYHLFKGQYSISPLKYRKSKQNLSMF